MSTKLAGLTVKQRGVIKVLQERAEHGANDKRITKLIEKWQTRAEAVALNKLAATDPRKRRARIADTSGRKLEAFIEGKLTDPTRTPSEFYKQISRFEDNQFASARARHIREQPKPLKTNPNLLTTVVYVPPTTTITS